MARQVKSRRVSFLSSLLLLAVVGLSACGDDHIDEFTIVKSPSTAFVPTTGATTGPAMPMSGAAPRTAAEVAADAALETLLMPQAGQPASQPQAIQWHPPADWQAVAAGGMRLASYQLPEAGDLSIISIGGDAGGMLANINRWRDQINLPPIQSDQVVAHSKQLQSAAGIFVAMQLINPALPDKAICGAFYRGSDFMLFVKLTGSTVCIEKNTAAVFAFCESANLVNDQSNKAP